ncbi:MAG: leucine-rich repeat domain-containing protein [Fimbriiglobus sp.]
MAKSKAKRVEEAVATVVAGEKILDLSEFYHVKELPEALRSCLWLKELRLGFNPIASLPDWVGDFKKLESLDLVNHQISSLPDTLGKLKNLRKLDIGGGKLKDFPVWLWKLKKLEHLVFSTSRSALTNSIGKLTALRHLEVNSTTFPASITALTHLEYLQLNSLDRLEELPADIGNLTQLRTLALNRCGLKRLPPSFAQLTHLENLHLRGCQLEELPSYFKYFPFQELELQDNALPKSLQAAANRGSASLIKALAKM